MSTGNNLEDIYNNSIRILKDLIAFKTVSGEDNNQLIENSNKIMEKAMHAKFTQHSDLKELLIETKNLEEIKARLSGFQHEAFERSYAYKKKHGVSPIKELKLKGEYK